MLRKVHIRGFKTATDAALELGRLNVLVGPNGSGKTNLLEAVGLLGCAASGRVDYDAFRARGVRPGTPGLYKTALSSEKQGTRTILLEAESENTFYRVGLGDPAIGRGGSTNAAWRFDEELFREGDQEVGSRVKRKGRVFRADGAKQSLTPQQDRGIGPLLGPIRGNGELASLLRALDGFAIYTPLPPMLRAQIPDPALKLPLGLMGGGLAEGLFSLQRAGTKSASLRSRLDQELSTLVDWVESVSFDSSTRWPGPLPDKVDSLAPHLTLRLRDRYLRSGASWLSAVEVNEGALYALFLLTILFHPSAPNVLAIDNIDHALSPRMARYVLERVQAIVLDEPERPQLLVTAHNPLALDALDLRDDRVRLFAVSRDKNSGATRVRRVHAGEATEQAKGGDVPLSRLWLSGALAGVPAV